jgi:hypothetical protein
MVLAGIPTRIGGLFDSEQDVHLIRAFQALLCIE